MNLYDLSDMYSEALLIANNMVDTETGELPENWANFLDEIEEERDEKALNIGRLIKNIDSEENAIALEIKNLNERRKPLANKVIRLKQWLLANIKEGEQFSDSNTVISWRKSSSVEVLDETKIPEIFFKVERRPMLTEIKKGIQDGCITENAAHIITKQNLQIK